MPHTSLLVFQDADGGCPLERWLEELETRQTKAFIKIVARIADLQSFGFELQRPAVGNLGCGVFELRSKLVTVQYRVLFGYVGQNVALLSHGCTKKDRVPKKEIDTARRRIELAKEDPKKFTKEFTV